MGTTTPTGLYIPDINESLSLWPAPMNAGLLAHDTYHGTNVAEYGKIGVWIQDQAYKSGRPYIDVRGYGAACDGKRALDAAISLSFPTILTSPSGLFTAAASLAGHNYIQVSNAGAAGAILQTTIASVPNTGAHAITSASASGGVATIVTADSHGFSPGYMAVITGTNNFNGSWVLLTASGNTFTFTLGSNPASESTGSVSIGGTTAILTAAASSAVSNTEALWGTLDGAAILGTGVGTAGAAWLGMSGGSGATLEFPRGICIVELDALLHITNPIMAGLAIGGCGPGASIIAQAGGWPNGLISTYGRHGYANSVRGGPLPTEGIEVLGNRGFNGNATDIWQLARLITRNFMVNNLSGRAINLTACDYPDIELTADNCGNAANGDPTVALQQNDEGGTTQAVVIAPQLKLTLTNSQGHALYMSQVPRPHVRCYIDGSGQQRSGIWMTDCSGWDIEGTVINCQDDNIHVQSEGNSANGRIAIHGGGAVGGTVGTGGAVNISSVTAAQTQVGHENKAYEGSVLGWATRVQAEVVTAEGTTALSYGDISGGTVGPSATIQVTPARPKVRVTISASMQQGTAGDGGLMGFSVDGGAVNDNNSCGSTVMGTNDKKRYEKTTIVGGLSFGPHSFVAKYEAVAGGTCTMSLRRLILEAVEA